MPICTSCTHPTEYLYTVYESAYNLRLEQCSVCHAFADPYVEHDTLTLLLDLILLKRDVYRHLLFNRGLGARKLGDAHDTVQSLTLQHNHTEPHTRDVRKAHVVEHKREKSRRMLTVKLGAFLIAIDAFIRWTHLSEYSLPDAYIIKDLAAWNRDALVGFLHIFVGCTVETVAFHAGVVLASFVVLHCLQQRVGSFRVLRLVNPPAVSGIRQEFRYSHVPLTLLYSSLTKLFLLFLLSIWRTPPDSSAPRRPDARTIFSHPLLVGALEVLDETKLDREWVVRNVLGGMAAGFGLRVVLDCHPFFTTLVILIGWTVKTAVASLVSEWVGAGIGIDVNASEMWLAYSIP